MAEHMAFPVDCFNISGGIIHVTLENQSDLIDMAEDKGQPVLIYEDYPLGSMSTVCDWWFTIIDGVVYQWLSPKEIKK